MKHFLLSFALLSPMDSCLWSFHYCFPDNNVFLFVYSLWLKDNLRAFFPSQVEGSFCVLISFSVGAFQFQKLFSVSTFVIRESFLLRFTFWRFSFWPHCVPFLWHAHGHLNWRYFLLFRGVCVCVWIHAYVYLCIYKSDLLH